MKGSALQLFEEGLEDISQHLMVADHIRCSTTAVISCAYGNLLRDTVTKTVGNIDAYFSKVLFELLVDRQAIYSANLSDKGDIRLSFSLKEVSELMVDVSEDPLRSNLALRRILDTKLRSLALQNHTVPNSLSRLFGVKDFWSLAQKDPLTKSLVGDTDIHRKYRALTERRNAISHNRDRDIIGSTTQCAISRDFVETGILTTRIIVSTFEREVVSAYMN
jgi:hypothetical protein